MTLVVKFSDYAISIIHRACLLTYSSCFDQKVIRSYLFFKHASTFIYIYIYMCVCVHYLFWEFELQQCCDHCKYSFFYSFMCMCMVIVNARIRSTNPICNTNVLFATISWKLSDGNFEVNCFEFKYIIFKIFWKEN